MKIRRIKLYAKVIHSCSDCPHSNWMKEDNDNPIVCEHPDFTKHRRWWTGRPTTIEIPKWCPLPDNVKN